jgi:cytochrome c6
MKRLLGIGLLALALTMFAFSRPALATDIASGAKVFGANCAACHMNGGNLVNATKTLRKDVLEKYEMASIEAIKTQVTNGKNAMPAFRSRLNAQQIEDVAAYVLDQAGKGW